MSTFLKLIRFSNLIIIGLTMYAVRFCFFSIGGKITVNETIEQVLFGLLVFSTLLIAAAGNIINDYFDIKSDKINKPENWIIGNIVPKRKAILYHWLLSAIAFGIAILLSIYYHTFWYVFIHLFSINILWLYSVYFKKTTLLGNFIVAFLTSLVVILTGIHFAINGSFSTDIPNSIFQSSKNVSYAIFEWKKIFLENGKFIWIFAFFSFILNFGREIIKDIEDIDGDRILSAKTLPLKYGINYAKISASFTLILIPISYFSLLIYFKRSVSLTEVYATIPVALSVLATIFSLLSLLKAKSMRDFKIADRLLKIAMIAGILTPFYWWWF
jgi:4-hydroxybenzoate polyprenyltransferase